MTKNPLADTSKRLGINPFIANLIVPISKIQLDSFKEITEDGEVIKLYDTISLEKTKFTKFFCSAERRKLLMNCTLRAKELVLWIMYDINSGEDYIWISKERYMREAEITSVNTYKEALLELIRYGVIALSGIPHVYWINPDFFFKGDRISKYPNNIIKQ
jgi:hypothetical protein